MLLNELAQWAVLLFLSVFVLGLTRQLGDFLVPRRVRVEQSRGPAIGSPLPPQVLTDMERARLLELMDERSVEWAVLMIVSEECPRCKELVEGVARTGSPDAPPVVAISSKSSPSHMALLGEAAELVIVDGDRLAKADLLVKPFVLIIDRSFTVRHKQLTQFLDEAVGAWRARTDSSTNGNRDDLEVAHVGGERS